jgi:outer membrane protein insertion porin family
MNFASVPLRHWFCLACFCLFANAAIAQAPEYFEVRDIEVIGNTRTDAAAIRLLSGISLGDSIRLNGDLFAKAIKLLWDQQLFEDIKIVNAKQVPGAVWLEIQVVEGPRLVGIQFFGIKKGPIDDLQNLLVDYRMTANSPLHKKAVRNVISSYYRENERPLATIEIIEKQTEQQQTDYEYHITIEPGPRCRASDLRIESDCDVSQAGMRKAMANTAPWRLLDPLRKSRYSDENFAEDQKALLEFIQNEGYTDATISSCRADHIKKGEFKLNVTIDCGQRYHLRNVSWVGNKLHTTVQLSEILGMKSGDVYDRDLLNRRLFYDNGRDLSGFYMDQGYVFFQCEVNELRVENDSVDIEIRVFEGVKARIGKVTIEGNVRTNDHVILREIETRPGDLFSRRSIIYSQQRLGQLGLFNPETIDIKPYPNKEDGTVDLVYKVEEVINDKLNLSGSWSPYNKTIVGGVGLDFKNFSLRNIFSREGWKGLPAGDGQRLNLSYQTTGNDYFSFAFGFTEPWLGGRKPNALSLSAYYSYRADGDSGSLNLYGGALGFSHRPKWLGRATMAHELSYQKYKMDSFDVFDLSTGTAENISYQLGFYRNTTKTLIYPREGFIFKSTFKTTSPESKWDGVSDYSDWTDQELYRRLEYFKIKSSVSIYRPLDKGKKLVLHGHMGFGYLGAYSQSKGVVPFERFFLGGAGFTLNSLEAREFIGLRGYEDGSVSAADGDPLIAKYTLELRYPIVLKPSLSMYLLGFAEAGNTWGALDEFDPFNVKKSAGFGARLYLPYIGQLGFDWGWGFDALENDASHVPGSGRPTITIGFNIGQL